MQGWIKLHRKILDSSVFDNPNLLKMWIWCLVKATHKDYTAMVGLEEIELKAGQFITGRSKGSLELNMNPSSWYKYLKRLEKLQMVSLNSNNKMTTVTVEKWELYQSDEFEKEQQNNNKITTKEQQNNTYKNNKNNKNIKNNIYIGFLDYWNSFNIVNHTERNQSVKREFDKIKSQKQLDEIKIAIKRYAEAYHDKNHYYKHIWTLDKFIKQSNGYVDWLDEGQRWIEYKQNKEGKSGGTKKNSGENEKKSLFETRDEWKDKPLPDSPW